MVGGATLAVWLFCVLALWVYAGESDAAQREEVVIHPGSAELIARGENPLALPSIWSFQSGDVLVLDNRDSVVHFVGPWSVDPGQIREVQLQASVPSVFCSVHPAGRLSINVEPRRTDWQLTVAPTLMLGPVLGLIAFGVRRVMSGLGDPETPDVGLTRPTGM